MNNVATFVIVLVGAVVVYELVLKPRTPAPSAGLFGDHFDLSGLFSLASLFSHGSDRSGRTTIPNDNSVGSSSSSTTSVGDFFS